MRNYYTYLLALVLLLTACGQGTQRYVIDQTKPVSAANRVIYQMIMIIPRERAQITARRGRISLMVISPRAIQMTKRIRKKVTSQKRRK